MWLCGKTFFFKKSNMIQMHFAAIFISIFVALSEKSIAGPGKDPTKELRSWSEIEDIDSFALPIPEESPFYKDVHRHYSIVWMELLKVYKEWIPTASMLSASQKVTASSHIARLEKTGPPKLFLIESNQHIAHHLRSKNYREIVLSTGAMQTVYFQLDSIVGILAHELTHAMQIDEILTASRVAEEQADQLCVQAIKASGYSPAGLINFFNAWTEIEEKERAKQSQTDPSFESPVGLLDLASEVLDPHRLNHIRARQIERLGPFAAVNRDHKIGLGHERTHHDPEILSLWNALELESPQLDNKAFGQEVIDVYERYIGDDEDFSAKDLYVRGGFQPLFKIWLNRIRSQPIRSLEDLYDHVGLFEIMYGVFRDDFNLELFGEALREHEMAGYTRFNHFVPEIKIDEMSPKDAVLSIVFEITKATYRGISDGHLPENDVDTALHDAMQYIVGREFEMPDPWYAFGRLIRIEESAIALQDFLDKIEVLPNAAEFSPREFSELAYRLFVKNLVFVDVLDRFTDSPLVFKHGHSAQDVLNAVPALFWKVVDRARTTEVLGNRWEFLIYIAAPELLEYLQVLRIDDFDDPLAVESSIETKPAFPKQLLFEESPSTEIRQRLLHLYNSFVTTSEGRQIIPNSSVFETIEKIVKDSVWLFEEFQAVRHSLFDADLILKRKVFPEYFSTRHGSEVEFINFPHSSIGIDILRHTSGTHESTSNVRIPRSTPIDAAHQPKNHYSALQNYLSHNQYILSRAHELYNRVKQKVLVADDLGNIASWLNDSEEHPLFEYEGSEFSEAEEDGLNEFDENRHLLLAILDIYGGNDLYGRSEHHLENYQHAAEFLQNLMLIVLKEDLILKSLVPSKVKNETAITSFLRETLPNYRLFTKRIAIDGAFSFLMHHPEYSEEVVSRQITTRIQKQAFVAYEHFRPMHARSFSERLQILQNLTFNHNISLYSDELADDFWNQVKTDELQSFVQAHTADELGRLINETVLSPALKQKIAHRVSTFLESPTALSEFFETLALGSSKQYFDFWEAYLSSESVPSQMPRLKIDRSLVQAITEARDRIDGNHQNNPITDENMFSQVFHTLDIAIKRFDADLLLRLTFHLADPGHYHFSKEDEQKIDHMFAEETPYAAFGGVKILRLYYNSLTETHRLGFLSYLLWSHPSALFQHETMRSIAGDHPLFTEESHPELTRLKNIFFDTLSFQDRAVILAHSLVGKYRGAFFSNHEFILTSLDILDVVGRKTAQILSAHGSFVPDDLRQKLRKFRDQNKHSQPLRIIQAIDSELIKQKGLSVWDEVAFFGHILGAGSMKTPIHATLHTGDEVVMKQLDPSILDRIDRNLLLLENGVRLWLEGGQSPYNSTILVLLGRLRESIRLEMNIDLENRNTLEHTRLQNARASQTTPLELIESLSTQRLSTVRFIPNQGNANNLALSSDTAEKIVDEILSQLVVDRFVHGDLQNPANILVDLNNRPVFIDLSLSRRVEPSDIALILKLHETLNQVERSVRNSGGSWFFKLRALTGKATSSDIVAEFRKQSPELFNDLADLINLLTHEEHTKGSADHARESTEFVERLLLDVCKRFLVSGEDRDRQAPSIDQGVSLVDIFLQVERMERVISARYVFIIEILAIVYEYEKMTSPSASTRHILESIISKIQDKLDGHDPRLSDEIKNASLKSTILSCRNAFEAKQ